MLAIPARYPFVLKLNLSGPFAVNTSMNINDPVCSCRIIISASEPEKIQYGAPLHCTGAFLSTCSLDEVGGGSPTTVNCLFLRSASRENDAAMPCRDLSRNTPMIEQSSLLVRELYRIRLPNRRP